MAKRSLGAEAELASAARCAYTPRSGPGAREATAEAMEQLAEAIQHGSVAPGRVQEIVGAAKAAGVREAVRTGFRVRR